MSRLIIAEVARRPVDLSEQSDNPHEARRARFRRRGVSDFICNACGRVEAMAPEWRLSPEEEKALLHAEDASDDNKLLH
jgi:hypothetical protein